MSNEPLDPAQRQALQSQVNHSTHAANDALRSALFMVKQAAEVTEDPELLEMGVALADLLGAVTDFTEKWVTVEYDES